MNNKITLVIYNREVVNEKWFPKQLEGMGRSRLYYVHNGECVLKNINGDFTLRKGYYYYIPQSYEFHPTNVSVNGFDHTYIDFVALPWQKIERILEIDKDAYPILAQAAQLPLSLVKILREPDGFANYHKTVETYISLFLDLILIEFKIDLERDSNIYNILEYIHNNYNQQINIQELAKKCHMSANYFISYFKQKFGTTPYKYIKDFRFIQAMNMLNSGASVNDTANAVGYTSISSFSNKFKEVYGFTPSQLLKDKFQKK